MEMEQFMNKYDFITSLQRHLTGKVSAEKLQELTDYYNHYIDREIRKGKSEEEVLASLGDPRLLAKSIVDAEGSEPYDADHGRAYGNHAYHVYEDGVTNKGDKYAGFRAKLKKVLIIIGIILLLCLILSTVFGIIGFIFRILVSFVLPLAIPLLLVWFFIRMWDHR